MKKILERQITLTRYEVWVSSNDKGWWLGTSGPSARMTKAQADGYAQKGFAIRYVQVTRTLKRRARGVVWKRAAARHHERLQEHIDA